MRYLLRAAIVALGAMGIASAHPAFASTVSIGFEDLAVDNAGVNRIGSVYSFGGYTITGSQLAVFGTDATRHQGSTGLFDDRINQMITLRRDGGGAFTLRSIDLAELNATPGLVGVDIFNRSIANFDITFMGLTEGGGTVSQTFRLDGVGGFETFFFNGLFRDVTSVSWRQAAPFHQFDNISAQVPVPASALLLLSALAGLAYIRRRRAA